MIENAVEDDADAIGVERFADFLKGRVITQTAVHLAVVDGVIAVTGAFKQRIEYQRVDAELFEVGNHVIYFIQPVIELTVVFSRCAAVAQRIDVVDNAFVDVTHSE